MSEKLEDEQREADRRWAEVNGMAFDCRRCGERTWLGPGEDWGLPRAVRKRMEAASRRYVKRGVCAGCGGRMY